MAVNRSDVDGVTERCDGCGRDTPHTIRIDIRTESRKRENAEFPAFDPRNMSQDSSHEPAGVFPR